MLRSFHRVRTDFSLRNLYERFGRETHQLVFHPKPITRLGRIVKVEQREVGSQSYAASKVGQIAVSSQHGVSNDVETMLIFGLCGWLNAPFDVLVGGVGGLCGVAFSVETILQLVGIHLVFGFHHGAFRVVIYDEKERNGLLSQVVHALSSLFPIVKIHSST